MSLKKKRSPVNIAVGILVLLLAAAGTVSLGLQLWRQISSSAGEKNRQRFAAYEAFIAPVIMNDPDTFDDITMADMDQLISITLWSILDDNPEPDQYEYTDKGMLLPKSEVEERFASLFGGERKPDHRSVDGGGIEFLYSEKEKSYIIPITGITPIYTPKVIEAEEKDKAVYLTVGYLASTDWQQDSQGNMVSPEPSKYMDITLGISADGSYYVRAIRKAERL